MIESAEGARESVSIFFGNPDFGLVAATLSRCGLASEETVRPARVESSCGLHTLRFTPMFWTGPGERLAVTILGALAYVRRIADPNTEESRSVLSGITACQLLVGVSATAGALSHDPCIGAVHAIAVEACGLIFDGDSILDPTGVVLISP